MTSAIEHMQAALALLVRQRTDLDRQIKVIERSIYELEQVSDSTPSPPERGKRTVAEVVGALAREQEIVTQAQIMQTLRQEGNTAQATSQFGAASRHCPSHTPEVIYQKTDGKPILAFNKTKLRHKEQTARYSRRIGRAFPVFL